MVIWGSPLAYVDEVAISLVNMVFLHSPSSISVVVSSHLVTNRHRRRRDSLVVMRIEAVRGLWLVVEEKT